MVLSKLPVVGSPVFVALSQRYTAMVMSRQSDSLTALFLGRHRPPKPLTITKCTYFHQ